ncbi:MAG: undecaprenyldiphospho-muramoylpentapeptide beta-N-acetylglucosaminyltransferase [Elainellaceae cyanobacterium]
MADVKKLLIAASGTGGHLFPAIATAEQLSDYQIEWLGVSNRLETRLVPGCYPMNIIEIEGFQTRFGLRTFQTLRQFVSSILEVRRLLQTGSFDGVLTTGGYIAAPAIIAARALGLPAILHESNVLPGKVTRWLSPWCTAVALGFDASVQYLPRAKTVCVGTPVRSQFRSRHDSSTEEISLVDLPIPPDVPLIVVIGGSQGAVAVNQLIRKCAPEWFEQGIWVVHLTGENDPDVKQLNHPQYFPLAFYNDMARLLKRANLAISRAGAGTLTELAITQTPSILIPYPYAAEDHQTFNAASFAAANAAIVCRQTELTPDILKTKVLDLFQSPERLNAMGAAAEKLAIADSAEQLAHLVRQCLNPSAPTSG